MIGCKLPSLFETLEYFTLYESKYVWRCFIYLVCDSRQVVFLMGLMCSFACCFRPFISWPRTKKEIIIKFWKSIDTLSRYEFWCDISSFYIWYDDMILFMFYDDLRCFLWCVWCIYDLFFRMSHFQLIKLSILSIKCGQLYRCYRRPIKIQAVLRCVWRLLELLVRFCTVFSTKKIIFFYFY